MTAVLDTTTVADLAAAVAGPVLVSGDDGYAEEVASFCLTHAAVPAVVVGAASADDVAAAVKWATRAGLRVSVQATGHGLLCDLADTVLVSTRRMDAVSVDPWTRTARVQAGVRWRQVIDAAALHGLAPLNGSSSNVGVVGYTLGGGLGPMARRFGFAADHVRRFTIVTADGAIRDVTAQSDPDLFWAVRGGKASFGIVTELEFALVSVTRFHGGSIFFPGESAADVLHAWRAWAPTLTDDTSTSIAMLRLPPDPALPEPLRGRFVVALRVVHLGSAAEGEAVLAPMRAVAPPLLDLVADMPYAAIDAVHMDPVAPMPVHDRGVTVGALPAEAVEALLAVAGPDVPAPLAMVEIRLLGGAIAREPEVADAVAGRDAAFSVFAIGAPFGPPVEAVRATLDAVVAAVEPWTCGGLLNFLGAATPERVGQLWDAPRRARLLAIRERVDPTELFATNVVIG
jgi:FAD binding domain-containing protein